jgi:hypothetical protein
MFAAERNEAHAWNRLAKPNARDARTGFSRSERWRPAGTANVCGRCRKPASADRFRPARFLDEDRSMHMTLSLAPLVSLIAGILILLIPRLLNFIVAIYLIVIGLIGLFGAGSFHPW